MQITLVRCVRVFGPEKNLLHESVFEKQVDFPDCLVRRNLLVVTDPDSDPVKIVEIVHDIRGRTYAFLEEVTYKMEDADEIREQIEFERNGWDDVGELPSYHK